MLVHQIPIDITITGLFDSQLHKIQDHIALIFNNEQLTYTQLNIKSNQIASWLSKHKIGQGSFVAILLEPNIDYIVLMLAILKIGAVYVPLDTLAPESRLKVILEDVKPCLVITDETYLPKIKNSHFESSLIKKIYLQSTSYSSETIKIEAKSLAPAYMMYTSGSTGKPKGVIISNQAIINLVKIDNYAQVKSNVHIGQFSNLAFDASTFEIWSALLNGCTLVIIPKEIRTKHEKLKNYLQKMKINYLFLPTGYFHQLVKSAPKTLDSVNVVVFGGEQANALLIKQFIEYRKSNNVPITLINGYGPTEATTFTCRHVMDENSQLSEEQFRSIGTPIKNVTLYILDEKLNEVPEGELYISGNNLALGYHNSQEQNQTKFIDNPFSQAPYFSKLYKTGDKVSRLKSGEFICQGRFDDQVKVGGFRIHLNEVEQQLMKHSSISLASVIVELGGGHHQILTAYIVFNSDNTPLSGDEIKEFLEQSLPIYMLPTKYVQIKEMPLTTVGKVDKKKLPIIEHIDLSLHIDASELHFTEKTIKSIWQHLLNLKSINTNKNFFDMGLNSLMLTEACHLLNKKLNTAIQISDLLTHSTVKKLTNFLEGELDNYTNPKAKSASLSTEIAIVGMSCRLPNSPDIDSFWKNLCEGIDCLSRFQSNYGNLDYVPVRGVIEDIELFDADFFNFSPADAIQLDPQHRLFLESVWEALEHSGIAPGKTNDIISVFAGMTDSSYLYENLLQKNQLYTDQDKFQHRIATSIGMLSTLVSYKLNLQGRSINVNSACSTGLLAVEQACQDLMLGYSDTAIAGSCSIVVPQDKGYVYCPGSILSEDGYCRPFSKDANGTVFSNGVGVVVLKRLDDAIKEGHTIYAVIKGRGVNNDGSDKLGFAAPSINGQINCINEAMTHANVAAEQIGMIEAHGTATLLGDLIEVRALHHIFSKQSEKINFCALSSVKANIGHTDVASGITGLIKTALCLYHKRIPPQIHFTSPNSDLNLDHSPFYINTQLKEWGSDTERYAGVSSFGVGGTNVHMILRAAPPVAQRTKKSEELEELIVISAKSKQSLDLYQDKLIDYLTVNSHKSETLSDCAHTLQNGREEFTYRKFAIGNNGSKIEQMLLKQPHTKHQSDIQYNMIWMFSGQGMQYHRMAIDLMDKVPSFKKNFLEGIDLANTYLNCDLLAIINDDSCDKINQTQFAQPALFIIEYALARLLLDVGIKPHVLIGHSLGEYVAACIADVFSFEDAIALVCERGLLMASVPNGEMLALDSSFDEVVEYQDIAKVDIALHNTHSSIVLSGAPKEIQSLENYLEKQGKTFKKLKVSHGFHSYLMESIEDSFKSMFHNIKSNAPKIPIISNVTGTWLSDKEAMDPNYWYKHLRQTVHFSKGIDLLLASNKHPFFLEIGVGNTLSSFVRANNGSPEHVIHTLPNHHKKTTDVYQLLYSLGVMWSNGIPIDLKSLSESTQKYIALPSYAFQRKKFWVQSDNQLGSAINSLQHNQNTKIDNSINNIIPQSPTEQKLSYLFGKILGINNVSKNDDFFELGGHSLAAIKLINDINRQFNTKITIQHFTMSSTISKLLLLINDHSIEQVPIIHPFNINPNTIKNIFIVHPISGIVSSLKTIAQAIPAHYSVYGLQDPSLSQEELLFDDIQAIAAAYSNEILKVQELGPYFLIGYSFGGTLAYEIVNQLKLMGKKIGLLCVIDSWAKHPIANSLTNVLDDLLDYPDSELSNDVHKQAKERLAMLSNHIPSKMNQEMILVKALDVLTPYKIIDHPINHWHISNQGKIICYPLNCNHEHLINREHSQSLINFLIQNEYLH